MTKDDMEAIVNDYSQLTKVNIRMARKIWGPFPPANLLALRQLTEDHQLSVAAGDILYLENGWYVTHSGLLRIAQRKKCAGIRTSVEKNLSNPISNRWVFTGTASLPSLSCTTV